jgi:hypothetical protein
MAHSRDVRTHASEVKFVVSSDLAAGIRRWARTHLDPDPHGSGPHQDEYRTTSVYFDTSDFDVFHRRGSFGRSKYRIRRYDDEAFVFLERKMRQPSVLAKRRTHAPIVQLDRLTTPETSVEWAGHWFHRRLLARQLQPVCQVSYRRTARVLAHDGEIVRLTLDANLSAQPTARIAFENKAGVPFMNDHAILELKFRGMLPATFKRLVEDFALNPQAASKYRLGLTAFRTIHETVPVSVLAQRHMPEAPYA